ncbi:16S rRNA (guanine(527)-N(7))-methyltransferase RsmG [Elusimicrobiota bacterium]
MNLLVDNMHINKYLDLLEEEKRAYGITGHKNREDIIEKSMNPSVILANLLEGNRGVDIGSGNGFPGIVISIVHPDKNIVLIEANQKKCSFLEAIKKRLQLDNIDIVNARAEELAVRSEFREKFLFATCRAVANLKISSELVLPFLEVGGIFYSQKGRKIYEEKRIADTLIEDLGGIVERIDENNIAYIRKKSLTPVQYPRKWKKIISDN